MTYKTVYAPDGQMFEVPQHIFEKVILQDGWTQSRPQIVGSVQPKATPKKTAKPTKTKSREVKESRPEFPSED